MYKDDKLLALSKNLFLNFLNCYCLQNFLNFFVFVSNRDGREKRKRGRDGRQNKKPARVHNTLDNRFSHRTDFLFARE